MPAFVSRGDLLRERKFEFCAWLVFEVSKNWAEADADIAETIDFCEFYAREALRLVAHHLRCKCPANAITLLYSAGRGRGDSAVEFSLCHHGRHDAGVDRRGNTVILKPSSDSPTIAAKFVELLEEAACPRAW